MHAHNNYKAIIDNIVDYQCVVTRSNPLTYFQSVL